MGQSSAAVLVFDEVVGSTTAITTKPMFNRLLGAYDKYAFHALCGPISVAGNLTVTLKHGSDERNWTAKNAGPEIPATALSTTDMKTILGTDTGTVVGQGFGQLSVQLSAGTARIQIYAVGRNT